MFEVIKNFFVNKSTRSKHEDPQKVLSSREGLCFKETKIPKIKQIKKTFISKTQANCNK